MPIKASESLYSYVKQAEGFRSEPYLDYGGKKTVGYGTSDNNPTKPVTEAEADKLMRDRVKLAESELSSYINRDDLTSGQQDALIDMHYNLGMESLRRGGFLDLVNQRRDNEVSENILKYTKASNAITGVKEELPGLVDRVNQRSQWWNGIQAPPEAEAGAPFDTDTQKLLESMDSFDAAVTTENTASPIDRVLGFGDSPAVNNQGIDSFINTSMEGFDQIGVIAPNSISDRISELDNARGVYSTEDISKKQKASRLSKELGIPEYLVQADLEIYSEEQIKTRAKIPEIAKELPLLAKWASTPENYVLMENTGDWTQTFSRSLQKLNPQVQSDLMNTLKSSALEYPKAAILVSRLYGAINNEQAAEGFNKIQVAQKALPISDAAKAELSNIQKVSEKLGIKNDVLFENLAKVYDKLTKEEINKSIIPLLKKSYDSSEESLVSVMDYFKSLYDNPTGAKLTTTQAAVSSGVPIAVGVGGSLALGPVVGVGGAFSISAMLAASESIQEDLAPFTNSNTGEIDFDAAFSDPERVARWRKRAATYGAVMGLSDAIYSKYIGGSSFVKLAKKKAVTRLAVGTTVGAIEEGASQATATVARDAVVGEVTSKTFSKAATQAVEEAAFGGLLGGTVSVTAGTINTGKQAYNKIKLGLDQASKANSDMANLHEAKTLLKSEEQAKQNTEAVKELIDVSSELPPIPDDLDIYSEVDDLGDSGADQLERNALNGTIQLAPSEVIEFFNSQGIDPDEVMSSLPADIFESYTQNKESDSSITIDLSDWMQVLEDFPEIDEIVRINGNELNAQEASSTIEQFQKNPFSLFDIINGEESIEQEDGELPPIDLPSTEQQLAEEVAGVDFENVPSDPNEVILLNDIRTRFRGEEQTKAYNTIKTRLGKLIRGVENIPNEAINAFAEVQYQRVKNRADILELDILEVARSQGMVANRPKGAAGYFMPMLNVVALHKDKADTSTLVHEFAHSWLDEMANDYVFLNNIPEENMTKAQLDYWQSMKIAADVLQVENVGVLANIPDEKNSDSIVRKAHETFAETAEDYFLEGKFANSKIKALMESFRKYMVSLVESIRNSFNRTRYSPLPVTPEIERMFEGIIGSADAIDEVLSPMFPEPMFDPSLLGEKSAEYYESTRDALTESMGIFASKIMNSSYRERESLIEGALSSILEEATVVVESQPDMVLASQMEGNYREYVDAKKKGLDVQDPRISYTSFLKLFNGDETAAEIARGSIPNYLIAGKKRGGMDAEMLMYNLGITRDADLVNMLMNMGTKDNQIQMEANRIVDEKFPILKSDEDIKKAAIESLSNYKVNRFHQMEMKILASKYLPTLKNLAEIFITSPETMMSDKYLDNKASELITNAKAYKFSSNKFRVDYGRHTRKAAAYFKKGDFANAFDQKVRASIAYKAHVQGIKAQKEIAKTTKRIQQFTKYSLNKDYNKRYNAELMLFGRKFIESVRKGELTLPSIDMSFFPSNSGVTVNVVETINEYVKEFGDRAKGRYGDNISVGNYIEMGEAIRFIQKVARMVKQVEMGNKMITIEDAQQAIINEFESSKYALTSFERNNILQKYRTNVTKVDYALASQYESDLAYSNSAMGSLTSSIYDGEAKKNLATAEDFSILTEALKKIALSGNKRNNFEATVYPILSRIVGAGSIWNYDKSNKPIVSKELGISFKNKAELIMAELLMGSPSGAEKFLRGGTIENQGNPLAGYDQNTGELDLSAWKKFRSRMISEKILTKDDFEAMQMIWDKFREKYPQLQKALRETDGYLVGNIAGWKVETEFGTYEGGYVPVSLQKQLNDASKFDVLDPDTHRLSASSLFPRQNTGMTNQRNAKFYPVSLDLNSTLMYMDAVNNIIHLRGPLINMGKVLGGVEVQKAMDSKLPGFYANVLLPWYQKTAQQVRSEKSSDDIARLLHMVRANVNRSIYLFRGLTALKQPLGQIPALTSIKASYLAKGNLKSILNPSEAKKFALDNSPIMRDRFEATVARHIRDWEDLKFNFDWIQETDEFIDKLTFAPIQFMQNRVDLAIWHGAYEQASDLGKTNKEAIRFADRIVNQSQGSSAISSLNSLQTSSVVSKFIMGIATSYLFTVNNVVRKSAMRQESTLRQAKALIGYGLLIYMTTNILDQVMEESYKALSSSAGDDEEEIAERERKGESAPQLMDRIENITGRAAVSALGTAVPIVGNLASAFMYSGSVDFAPLFSKLTKETSYAVNGANRISQGISVTPREMKAILNSITLFTGIPTSALAKDIFIEDVWIEGLQGETLDDRLRERRYELNKRKWEERE